MCKRIADLLRLSKASSFLNWALPSGFQIIWIIGWALGTITHPFSATLLKKLTMPESLLDISITIVYGGKSARSVGKKAQIDHS